MHSQKVIENAESKEEFNRNKILNLGNKIENNEERFIRNTPSNNFSSINNVYININFTKINDIDTINQRFQAQIEIESKWYDSTVISDSIDEKKIWKPDLYVENGIKDVREEVTYHVLKNDQKSCNICEIRKVTGIFYEKLELENFPRKSSASYVKFLFIILCFFFLLVDVQDLTITVATKKPGNEVNFEILQKKETKKITISDTLDKSIWRMHDALFTKLTVISRQYTHKTLTYPGILVAAKVFRIPRFFYWNAILPILLVTLASLAPFVVDIKIPQSRLPSTCTLMLTSVSLRWTIGRLLPTVSYLTPLDKYSLCSMLIITMELLYHAIMGAIFPNLKEKDAYNIDKGFFKLFCILILLKQVIFFIWYLRIKKKRENIPKENFKLNDEASEKSNDRRERPIVLKYLNNWTLKKNNSKHQIDIESQNEQNQTVFLNNNK